MSIDEAISLMSFTETLWDGTAWGVFRIRLLTDVLMANPEEFWELYFATADPAAYLDSMESGAAIIAELGEDATHGDLRMLMELEHKRLTQ